MRASSKGRCERDLVGSNACCMRGEKGLDRRAGAPRSVISGPAATVAEEIAFNQQIFEIISQV
jgi:hypothetical protein